MASRSLTASQSGIAAIDNKLTAKKWSYENLASAAGVGRTSAINFCTGKKVDRKNFVICCEKLDLDWEVISGQKTVATPAAEPTADINSLVQQLRASSGDSLRKRCGTMRILDMTQPIDSGAIYTDVNILERVAGKTRAEISQLMPEYGAEEFNRFSLGGVKQQRVPGLDAVLDKRKLMIFGRPGAGKTTFLRRLAIECLNGNFLADRLPMFVTLKEFSEEAGQPGIVEFMARKVEFSDDLYYTTRNPIKKLAWEMGLGGSPFYKTLKNGQALILLDGLDEVKEEDHDRVIREIQEFAERYSQNHIVITCRIAAREYIFQQFTEVEMADFDDGQIRSFADKWFRTQEENPESTTGQMFWKELESREPVKELAANPLLLTLLCLEFDHSSAFPQSRSELYDRALEVLLRKWDGQRRIQRGEEVYKGLSLKRKESLLGQLAMYTFERSDYFFKEKVATNQIEQYIRNLPGAKENPAALEVDSRAVLKSIESRHGLLSERAMGIYSFSHLTFQEYFTAKNILDLSDPAAQKLALEKLTEHIGEKRWREVLLLVVEGLDKADYLLILMKQRIDLIVRDNSELQNFLEFVQTVSKSVRVTYKTSMVRAFYLDRAYARALDSALVRDRSIIRDLTLARTLDRNFDLDLDLALDPYLTCDLDRDRDLNEKLGSLNDNQWTANLRTIMITQRNIGHDWQFTDEQKAKLQQYYDANLLLANCLNSECYVSREVREEIEATMLLPMAEIEKWKIENAELRIEKKR
jgi:predicted NACHT family NTPase